jgi:predicted RNA-binding protein Jag
MEPKSRIFEGKTLEEAVRKGLDAFGLTRAEVMITTMQEGSGGFFGLGGRPFKVRIQARPGGAPRDVEERAPRSDARGGRDRGGRGERDRGGRGGRDRGGRSGERERGGRGERERGAAPVRAEQGRGGRQESRRDPARAPQSRGPERERGGRGRGGSNERERGGSNERERGGSNERERGGSNERERGGSNERERGGSNERERGGSNERETRRETPPPMTPMTPAAVDSQPPVGARGFEDRRRPGDRREEEGDAPRGEDRRSGDDRRQMAGAEGGEVGGDGRRRRRRGRRGGRGRRRGGAEIVSGLETSSPPVGPATAEAMASDLPTDIRRYEPERLEANEPEYAPIERMMDPAPAAFESDPEPAGLHASGSGGGDAPSSWADVSPAESREPRETREPREYRDPRESHGPREPREPSNAPALSGDELAATSRKVTDDLFRAMGFEGKVTATLSGPDKVEVVVEVSDDEELLTGRKGETRQALQHLLNRMVNKGEGSRYHVQLEINDFWKHREEELAEMARGMADRAVTSGQEQVTDFLNAQERRIIHVTLREDTRVKTYALGDGMIKRLAVAPAHAETMGAES